MIVVSYLVLKGVSIMRKVNRRSAGALAAFLIGCAVSLSGADGERLRFLPGSDQPGQPDDIERSRCDCRAGSRPSRTRSSPPCSCPTSSCSSSQPNHGRRNTCATSCGSINIASVDASLFSGAVPESKVFFQDMGCDGLSLPGSGSTDDDERGTVQTVFDGDWKRQKLSKEQYGTKSYERRMPRYGRLLQLLTQGVATGV